MTVSSKRYISLVKVNVLIQYDITIVQFHIIQFSKHFKIRYYQNTFFQEGKTNFQEINTMCWVNEVASG